MLVYDLVNILLLVVLIVILVFLVYIVLLVVILILLVVLGLLLLQHEILMDWVILQVLVAESLQLVAVDVA